MSTALSGTRGVKELAAGEVVDKVPVMYVNAATAAVEMSRGDGEPVNQPARAVSRARVPDAE
jgi:hypothetical protein